MQQVLNTLANIFKSYSDEQTIDNPIDQNLYIVGGCVRNRILGIPVHDVDICSALTPDRVIKLCKKNNFGYIEKGIRFGMIEIHIEQNGKTYTFEHTTFRADTYPEGGSHIPTKVVFAASPKEDAQRRDFSINAIYQNILTGEIIDPIGGKIDLDRRVIRATNNDPMVIMKDDGLRILRMVRFACELGFSIDYSTFEAARSCVAGLKSISMERIRDELFSILLSDVKYGAPQKTAMEVFAAEESNEQPPLLTPETSPVLRGLLMLKDLGALSVILPEFDACDGYPQKPKYHKYDVLQHIFHVTAEVPPILRLRLAGLFHDIGKPEAHKLNEFKNMATHDKIGTQLARSALLRLRCPTKLTEQVCKMVYVHMFDIAGVAKENSMRMRFVSWGEDVTVDLIEFRRADIRGTGTELRSIDSAKRFYSLYTKMKEEKVPFSTYELMINGYDITRHLHAYPSPEIGMVKQMLLRHCSVYPKCNNFHDLIKLSELFYAEACQKTGRKNVP